MASSLPSMRRWPTPCGSGFEVLTERRPSPGRGSWPGVRQSAMAAAREAAPSGASPICLSKADIRGSEAVFGLTLPARLVTRTVPRPSGIATTRSTPLIPPVPGPSFSN